MLIIICFKHIVTDNKKLEYLCKFWYLQTVESGSEPQISSTFNFNSI